MYPLLSLLSLALSISLFTPPIGKLADGNTRGIPLEEELLSNVSLDVVRDRFQKMKPCRKQLLIYCNFVILL
jgi:hypothetical protein